MRVDIIGWPDYKIAMQGMRLSFSSYHKSDSSSSCIGEDDLRLAKKLANSGSSHRKFMRFLSVILDVDAPLFWWKQFDQYKISTSTLSTSTMHTLHKIDKFEQRHFETQIPSVLLDYLNNYLTTFKRAHEKSVWYELIGMLPSSFLQQRFVFLNYEVLRTVCEQRSKHKLPEWHFFCQRIKEDLLYPELVFGEDS